MTLEHTTERRARLDAVLHTDMGISAGLIRRLKWQNALFVNGEPAHTDRIVLPGDAVLVCIEESAEGFEPEPMALSILYEDEAILAVDKPSGMLVHPSPQKNSGTLANGILGYFRETGTASAVHPVTRLDRDTFGVVLAAKTAHIHAKFCALLKQGQMKKVYLASVFGAPAQDAGVIDIPVYKLGNGSLLRIADPRGKRAVTEYRVLQRYAQTALVELHPLTGRTHQLRLHCKATGFPILGDPQYHSPASALFSAQHGLFTQQLCAAELSFVHPMTGESIVIRSAQSPLLPEVIDNSF